MYTVDVNLPNMAKGTPVEIDGLGVYENGSSFEVDDDQAQAFRDKHSTMVTTYDEDGTMHNERMPGPTLLQAFKGHEGISVQTSKRKKKDDDNQPELPLGEDEGVTNNG